MTIRLPRIIREIKFRFAELFFLLGIFLKQFYLRRSGSIQISDAVIAFSVFAFLFSRRMRFFKTDVPLILFVACVFVINGLYQLYYGGILHKNYSAKFMMAAIYLLYNLAVVMAFRIFILDSAFIKALAFTMKLNLLSQLFIYLSGMGRYFWGVYRYQGTFNDPNQFGFFVICCLFMLFLCSAHEKQEVFFVWYALAGYLVLLSSSRGMTLALLVFLLFAVIIPFLSEKRPSVRFLYIVLFLFAAVFLLLGGSNLLSVFSGDQYFRFLIDRITSRSSGSSIRQRLYSFLDDRSMYRILYAPQYFLFGSGEGYHERFFYTTDGGEMHSTMIALCYYYGIMPYALFLKWLSDNLRDIPRRSVGVFIALILEAFTLANHRQPLFWTMFVMGGLLAAQSQGERGVKINTDGYQIQRDRARI